MNWHSVHRSVRVHFATHFASRQEKTDIFRKFDFCVWHVWCCYNYFLCFMSRGGRAVQKVGGRGGGGGVRCV